MDDPESDGMTYRTLKWGHDTPADALRDLEVLKQDPAYAGASLVVIQTIENPE
jgi:hypothetical protein